MPKLRIRVFSFLKTEEVSQRCNSLSKSRTKFVMAASYSQMLLGRMLLNDMAGTSAEDGTVETDIIVSSLPSKAGQFDRSNMDDKPG